MNTTALLLLAQAAAPQRPSAWVQFLPLIAMVAIFYFMLIVPRQREVKRHQQLLGTLQKGDAVVTSGGLVGEIQSVREDQVTLRSGTSVLVVEKSRVVRKLTPPAPGK